MESQKKNVLRVAAILAVGVFFSWLIVVSKPSLQPEAIKEEPPHIADVIEVHLQPRAISVFSQGTVKPKTEIEITAQVSGEVVAVGHHFAAGGYFDQGEMLLRLDQSDYEIALIKAEAAVAEAQKLLAQEEGYVRQARREWRDLGNEQANQLFLRQPQLAAAKANLRAAEASLRQARLDLERTTIKLPFAGRVRSVDANLGQYINKGGVVGSVFASDVMEVRLPLTAAELALLNMQSVEKLHELKPLEVDLFFDAGHDRWRWHGAVVRMEASVDEKSRLFYLVAEISNPEMLSAGDPHSAGQSPIFPGTFVEAKITSNPHSDVMVLPRSALYQSDQVLVLDEESRLRVYPVMVLQVDSEQLIVKALQNGQQVLAKPPAFMDMGAVYSSAPYPAGVSKE